MWTVTDRKTWLCGWLTGALLLGCGSSNGSDRMAATGGSASGTGGSSSGGAGSVTGGSGGTTADAPCNGAPAAPAITLSNLESDDTQSWYGFTDGTESTAEGIGIDDGGPVSPGAAGTDGSAYLSVVGSTSWGAGIGFFAGCKNLSEVDGLSFWAKSAVPDAVVKVQVANRGSQPDSSGGECAEECNNHYFKNFTLTTEWKQYSFLWGELSAESWGPSRKWTDELLAVNFGMTGEDIEYWIDEVAFFSGEGPGAGSGGSSASGGSGGTMNAGGAGGGG